MEAPMKVIDKRDRVEIEVDVAHEECLSLECYWPRRHQGTYVQGRGYRGANWEYWICGTREIHGCPDDPKKLEEKP